MNLVFLTEKELEGYLYMIRNTLCTYNYEKLDNVIFFNNEVVFEYLCDIPIETVNMTVGEALDEIGPYIPISLNSNSINFIMQSAISPEDLPTLEGDFEKTNKMDFMQLITSIDSPKEWSNLINLCETIRQFRVKEEEAVLT